jgi:hypothetical protein
MAVLHVPSQYTTIQAAIAASADGDDIVVDGGTHPAISFASHTTRSSLRIRAKEGTRPIISGTGLLIVLGANNSSLAFEGLKFIRTGSSTAQLMTTAGTGNTGYSFVDCVFDCTQWTGNAIWLNVRAGPGSVFLVIARCVFLGNGTNGGAAVLQTGASGVGGVTLIEGNFFYRCRGSTYVLYLNESTPTGTLIVRNNTLVQCSTVKTIVRMVGTNKTRLFYNNVIQDQVQTTPGSTLFSIAFPAGGPVFCANNNVHNVSGATTNIFEVDSGNNNTLTSDVGTDGKPLNPSPTHPCYRSGVALSGLGERRVFVGQNNRSFFTVPDRGAFPMRLGRKSSFYLKPKHTDILSGVAFTYGLLGVVPMPSTRRTYDSPWNVCQALYYELTKTSDRRFGPVMVFYDEEHNRYRIAVGRASFNLTISGGAAKVFGSASLTGISDTG